MLRSDVIRLKPCVNPFFGSLSLLQISEVTSSGLVEEAVPFPLDLDEEMITPMMVDEL